MQHIVAGFTWPQAERDPRRVAGAKALPPGGGCGERRGGHAVEMALRPRRALPPPRHLAETSIVVR